MGSLDTAMASVAQAVVGIFVSTPTSLRRTTKVYDETTGVDTPTVSTFSFIAAPPSPYEQREIDGTTIRADDLQILIPASNVPAGMGAPAKETDDVQVDGTWLRVIAVNPIKSGDSAAAYQLQLRA